MAAATRRGSAVKPMAPARGYGAWTALPSRARFGEKSAAAASAAVSLTPPAP
jgi:hypothetical protein